jgi:hypothetical protein
LIRAWTILRNNDSREGQLRVFSVFLSFASGKHGRITP